MANFLQIPIYLDKTDYEELHSLKDMKIENEYGVTIYKLTEAGTWQQWYREIIRSGIRAKLVEFEKNKRQLEDENKNCIQKN